MIRIFNLVVLSLFFILLILIFFSVTNARAAPFLICDPQTNVTHYIVTIDGVTTTSPAFDLGDGKVRLSVDLKDSPEGEHTCSIKAANLWDESDPVPFVFTRAGPDVLVNVRIQ